MTVLIERPTFKVGVGACLQTWCIGLAWRWLRRGPACNRKQEWELEIILRPLPCFYLHVTSTVLVPLPPIDWSKVCRGFEHGTGPSCCSRAGQYNGFGSDGPLLFHCLKNCPCHD